MPRMLLDLSPSHSRCVAQTPPTEDALSSRHTEAEGWTSRYVLRAARPLQPVILEWIYIESVEGDVPAPMTRRSRVSIVSSTNVRWNVHGADGGTNDGYKCTLCGQLTRRMQHRPSHFVFAR